MSELIDRQALLDKCLNHYEVGNIEQNCTMDWICKTVRNAPTASPWHRVEDGLPEMSECVVRMEMPKNCGECRFRSDGWCYGIRAFDPLEKKLGRPIWTHEFANKSIWEEIREKIKPDFLKICEEVQE